MDTFNTIIESFQSFFEICLSSLSYLSSATWKIQNWPLFVPQFFPCELALWHTLPPSVNAVFSSCEIQSSNLYNKKLPREGQNRLASGSNLISSILPFFFALLAEYMALPDVRMAVLFMKAVPHKSEKLALISVAHHLFWLFPYTSPWPSSVLEPRLPIALFNRRTALN